MKIATDEEFKRQAGEMLDSAEPVCITHNGKPAGVYISLESGALPSELRRALFFQLAEQIGQELAEKGITEEQVLAEFEAARKNRRRR